ncbi:MAG: hypothetical protein ACQER9_01140 [Nanobdellota archaeon]
MKNKIIMTIFGVMLVMLSSMVFASIEIDGPTDDEIIYGQEWNGAEFTADNTSAPIDTWWVNDEDNFEIDQDGFLNWTEELSVESYSVEISVNDTDGNKNSTDFELVVKEDIIVEGEHKDESEAVKRSNPLPEGSDEEELDDEDELEYAKFEISVTAPEDRSVEITDIEFDLPSGFSKSDYNFDSDFEDTEIVKTPQLPIKIESGESDDIDIEILIPFDLDAVDSNGKWIEYSVDFTVDTSEGDKKASLKYYVENGIEADKFEIVTEDGTYNCDYDDLWDTTLDCDDEVEELPIGKDFDVTFVLENIFDRDSDIDLDDIEITIDTDNRDVEADDDNFDVDVDADDEETVTITFEVDEDVEDGDEVTIEIQGEVEDENGAKHGFYYEFDVEFKVPRYKVSMEDLRVNPDVVCPGDYTFVSFEVINEGEEDQDNLRFLIEDTVLGWSKSGSRFQLEGADDGDFEEENVEVRLQVPEDAEPRTYAPSVNLYYESDDDDDEQMFETFNFVVEDCGTTETEDEEEETQNEDTGIVVDNQSGQAATNDSVSVDDQQDVSTDETVAVAQPESDNDALFIGGMIVLIVILLAAVISMVFVILRK